MLTLILLSLSLQSVQSVQSVELTESGVVASSTSRTRGVEWNFKLTREALDKSPDWPEADEWPPLSPKRAIGLAFEQLGTLVGDTEGWRFDSVSLKTIGPKNTWIYVVEISEPPPRADGGIHSSIRLFVLLDGTTVTPVRRPQPGAVK